MAPRIIRVFYFLHCFLLFICVRLTRDLINATYLLTLPITPHCHLILFYHLLLCLEDQIILTTRIEDWALAVGVRSSFFCSIM